MSQQRWYVCADGEGATWLASAVSQVHGTRDVRVGSDPWELRKALLAELPGSSSVAILTGCQGMEPINLAAALVRDAHAREVVLVCDGATGSLRSRARRAGVTRVVEASELASAVRVGAKGQEHGKAPARKASAWTAGGESDQMGDLDEPDCLGMTAPSRPVTGMPQAPVLVFASGRGGVGKTTLVAVAAHVAESWGMRVAIVDFDLAFGNLFGFLGLDGPADLAPLGAVREDLPSAIVRCGRKVDDSVALWGPCVRPELAETVQPHAGSILRTLSSRYDLVLVDTSTTWGDAIAQGVQCCDRLLLVADERAGAVASLARAAALAVRLGVARTRIMRVMNRCDARHRDEGFLARADLGLETARSLRVLEGGDEVSELLSSGHAKQLATLDNPLARSLATLLATVLEELGRLPDVPAAKAALTDKPHARKSRRGHMREAS